MSKIEEFDERMAKKKEYLAGNITVGEYSKWLNDVDRAPKLIIPAKKVIIEPNLAFRVKKFHETLSSRLTAANTTKLVKKMVPIGEGKYKWMEHDNDDDEDIPF